MIPVPALGLVTSTSGRQTFAQPAEQALLPAGSFAKRYSVWPCEFTRIRPSGVLRSETVAAELTALLAGRVAAKNPTVPRAVASVTAMTDECFGLGMPRLLV